LALTPDITSENRTIGLMPARRLELGMAEAAPASDDVVDKPSKKRQGLTEKGRALWVLALLSPAIAEMLSGSSPPREFFFPLSFAFLLGLYGAGVLVVREVSVIWNKGWASVIVLGAAYGILEEGVAVKSFFDPEWMDLGRLGKYGRVMGTNWVWAVWLTIYHSSVSIALPILIVSMLYPHLRNERFLLGRKFPIVLVILFLDVVACATLLNPYDANSGMYLLSIIAVFAFVGLAALLPKELLKAARQKAILKARSFFALGFVFLFVSFVIASAFVETEVSFLVPILLLLAISGSVLLALLSCMSLSNIKVEKAHFASGMLGFLLVLSLVLTFSGWIDMVLCLVLSTIFIIDFTRWSRGRPTLVAHRFTWFIYGEK